MVGPPLWKIWKSIGMIIPNINGKIEHVPNHQPDKIANQSGCLWTPQFSPHLPAWLKSSRSKFTILFPLGLRGVLLSWVQPGMEKHGKVEGSVFFSNFKRSFCILTGNTTVTSYVGWKIFHQTQEMFLAGTFHCPSSCQVSVPTDVITFSIKNPPRFKESPTIWKYPMAPSENSAVTNKIKVYAQ